MAVFQHFILTRFNVKVDYSPARNGLNPEWLSHRFELFEQFCYPSVRSQSNQNFKWLVYFDSETPDDFKAKIKQYAEWQNFIPVFLDGQFSQEINRAIILEHLEKDTEFLITTRLDNDDAVAVNFVQTIQNSFARQPLEFLNLTNGYVWSNNRLYSFEYLHNPFMSLIEKVNLQASNGFKTILCGEHTQIAAYGAIRQIRSKPIWLQVIHGKNVSNRIRGIRQPITRLGEDFSIDPNCIPSQEDQISYWVDKGVTLIKFPVDEIAVRLPKGMRTYIRKHLLFKG
jgi:glutaredoxin-related protein